MSGMKRKEKQGKHAFRLADSRAPFYYAEAYKALGINIDFLAAQNQCKSIMVTSPGPGDGKTTLAVNLAYTLGNIGKKVILIDGDMRKGDIASCLRIESGTYGLSEILTRQRKLADVIIHRQDLKTDILTVGTLPHNPGELAGSKEMDGLLSGLEKTYDYVVMDTPSVLLVTDGIMISRMADGVLLVCRAGVTDKQELSLCKRKLEAVDAHILGTVLNDCSSSHGWRRNKNYYAGFGDRK